MGVSPARAANVKLPDRWLLVWWNDLLLEQQAPCEQHKQQNNNYSNTKDINIKTAYIELTIYHQNVSGLGNKVI